MKYENSLFDRFKLYLKQGYCTDIVPDSKKSLKMVVKYRPNFEIRILIYFGRAVTCYQSVRLHR